MMTLQGEDFRYLTQILLAISVLSLQCQSQILINEINADNPLYDIKEYIELVNNGTQAVNLSSYTVVLYNGNNNRAYRVLPLSGMLNPGEFFVIGSGNVRPTPDMTISQNILQNGLDAVALYDSADGFRQRMLVTNDSLVDAVVYDDGGFVGSHTLLDVLMPGQAAVHENAFVSPIDDESISRCDMSGLRNSSHFAMMPLTPGQPNLCNSSTLYSLIPTPMPDTTASPMRISEINADNPGSDFMEFIELYNNGDTEVDLNNYTVALFNGRNNRIYRLFYLTGYRIEARGYFLIGPYRIRPTPDFIVSNASNANFLQIGPDAVALYYDQPTAISTGMRSSTNLDLLVDAVVYDRRGGRILTLTTVLTPGEATIHEDRDYFDVDESISRCRGMDVRKSSPFKLTPATPGAPNNCSIPEVTPTPTPPAPNDSCEIKTPQSSVSFINELHIWTDGPQYIELVINADQLENYVLAIFTRYTGSLYRTIHLKDYKTTNGYIVIGHPSDTFTPDVVIEGFRIPRSGINAIALFYEDANKLIGNAEVTSCNLCDSVVYGRTRFLNNKLQQTLIPGQTPLRPPTDVGGETLSLGRCRGWKPSMLSSFTAMPQSPGLENACQIPEMYINEINIYQTADSPPFIEIYDGGIGYQPLDGLVLLLYRPSYITSAFDLTGASTDRYGYFVIPSIGSNVTSLLRFRTNTLSPPIGVGLVLSPPVYTMAIKVTSKVDAVVYGDDVSVELLERMTPGQDQIKTPPEPESILRCDLSQRLSNEMFGHGPSSKWQLNTDCRRNNQTVSESSPHYQDRVRINEINVNQPGRDVAEYIELLGFANTSLDGMKVVLFNGNDRERAYKIFDLTGYQTNSEGFFLIGASVNGSQPQMLVTDQVWLQNGPDAVALYKNSNIDIGDQATTDSIVDAIVYGTKRRVDRRLLRLLVPGQKQIMENTSHHQGDEAILRCHSNLPLEQYAFDLGYPSPGQPNKCPLPPVVINEINIHAEGHTGVYIELKTPGKPNFPLEDLLLVEYVDENKLDKISIINELRTNADGLLLLADYGSPLPYDTFLFTGLSQLSNNEGAIALFRGYKYLNLEETPTSDGLVDAIVFKKQSETYHWTRPASISLSTVREVVIETWDQSTVDESINRCEYANETVYLVRTLSPKTLNHCPPRHNITLVINEINMVSVEQYIEIWDLGYGSTELDGFLIVLFSESGHSYFTIDLTGYITDQDGYLVVGVRTTEPYPSLILAPGFMRTSTGAVAIYKAAFELFADQGRTTTGGLIDSVVYSDYINPLTGWTTYLYSGQPPVLSSMLQNSGQSFSRCYSLERNSPRPFVVSDPTPESLNACPIQTDDILINEIRVVPGYIWDYQAYDYIELRSSNEQWMDLTGISVVLYSGNDHDRAYGAYDLTGYSTDDDGYFLISNDKKKADLFVDSGNMGFLQTGPNAVTIYRAPSGAFLHGTTVTTTSLIDAVVYTYWEDDPSSLLDELVPGQPILMFNEANNKSMSRCYGKDKRHQNSFVSTKPSPNRENRCKGNSDNYPAVTINELNVDNSESDTHEFLELYDFGVGNTKLDGLILVFFDGMNDDKSYFEVDLTGQKTNRNGFFVIGSANIEPRPGIIVTTNFIQNGPDAVVLYHATAQQFPRGSPVSKENVVDALIYGTNDSGDRTLLDVLAPDQIIVNENEKHNPGEESMSRCLSNLPVTFSAFLNSQPTPGAFNNCTLTKIVINEVNADEPGTDAADFIELFDGGRGYASLDSLVVVIFDGGSSQSIKTIPLQNYQTDSNGYFLIGSGLENLDIDTRDGGFLENGPGAVALYRGDHRNLSFGLFPTRTHLEDVLVYSTNEEVNLPLLTNLLPGQVEVLEDSNFMEGDESINRCFSQDLQSSAAFGLGKPTPKQRNNCTGIADNQAVKPRKSKIIINEINPSSESDAGPQFVELKGDPGHYLESFVLVFYEVFEIGTRIYYRSSLGKNSINENGFFIVGEQGMNPSPDLTIGYQVGEVIHSATSAVALYLGTEEQFPIGGIITTENLQDAIIYTTYNTSTETDFVLQELTPNQGVFYENNQLLPFQVSISRCVCCETRTTNAFMMSTITPGKENVCPVKSFLKTIQMRLINADYDRFNGDDFLLSAVQEVVVKGIESKCQCGFSPAYFSRSKFLNGSVVFQTDMSAINQSQADRLFSSYQDFIKDTPSVIVASMNFSVDTSCIVGCVADDEMPMPVKQDINSGLNAGLVVAVAISVVTGVAIVTIIVYMMRKKQLCKCRRQAFNDDVFKVTKNQDLNDLDVLSAVHDYHQPAVDVVTTSSSVSGTVP